MRESHTARVTAGNWLCLFSVVAAVLFALAPLTRAQGGEGLTNEDVIKMVRAQLAATVILTTIQSATTKFDLSPAGLIALKEAGVEDRIIEAMQAKARVQTDGSIDGSARNVPEKSELLASSKDPDFILRNFKTMLVDATRATYFGSQQMKAAIGANRDFMALKVSIVDDPTVADVVLTVSYTFAWDYPFTLKHQNTSLMLLSGKGSGAFSGPKGASSVASELVKALKPYRVAPSQPVRKGK